MLSPLFRPPQWVVQTVPYLLLPVFLKCVRSCCWRCFKMWLPLTPKLWEDGSGEMWLRVCRHTIITRWCERANGTERHFLVLAFHRQTLTSARSHNNFHSHSALRVLIVVGREWGVEGGHLCPNMRADTRYSTFGSDSREKKFTRKFTTSGWMLLTVRCWTTASADNFLVAFYLFFFLYKLSARRSMLQSDGNWGSNWEDPNEVLKYHWKWYFYSE